MLEVYKNMKKRRLELGMSQAEFGKLCGYKSQTSVAKLEAGLIDMPYTKFLKAAVALESTPGALLGKSFTEPTDGLDE